MDVNSSRSVIHTGTSGFFHISIISGIKLLVVTSCNCVTF